MFDFRFYEIWRSADYVEKILLGCLTSIELSVLGGILGFVMGLVLAIMRGPRVGRVLRMAAISYIELVRNTPFIVQLFFVAFGLPRILLYQWSFEASALLAMVLNFSAYFAELIRAGIEDTPTGQIEAAKSLGIRPHHIFLDVVLPQALAKIYPSITSQFIFLFLTTGLIAEISVQDLTWSGRYVADRTFRDFEVFIVLTILYILIVFMFRTLFELIQRWSMPWWRAK